MAEFLDSEAVLSEGEEELDQCRKKRTIKVMEDSEEEEDDDENILQEELKDLIDDAPIEESEDENSISGKSKRRRKSDDEYYDDRLEDDDYDLIEENLGITVERRQYKRLKRIQDKESDEEEEEEISKERETIANELFESGSGDEEERRSEIGHRPQQETLDEESSGEDSSDADDFIVDDEGRPISEKRRKKKPIYSNPALQQAQDIFGINFDYSEFDKYGEEEDVEDNDEDESPRNREKSQAVKRTRRTIFEIYEPSELKRGHFTDIDNEIRNVDIPERMQLRSIPITPVPEGSDELDHESQWIFQQAFNRPTISVQNAHLNPDQEFAQKESQIIPKIKKVLDFMRNLNLEVPFISFYRKEHITPELNMNDLWKIYKFDAQWCQLRQRKENLLVLFENMRNFQMNEIMKNPDAPLPESLRVINEDDIDRLKSVQTNEELNDVHHHFILYYSHDIPAMQETMRKQERQTKRLAKMQKRQKQLLEAEENGEDPPSETEIEIEEVDETEVTLKQAVRTGPYAICRKAGLNCFAKKFGLTPEQFAENLRDNYQRHEVEQESVDPGVVSLDYIGLNFKSSDEVLKAVQLMVAIQLARDPLVRKCVREMYMERAKLSVKPTKKGIKEIDENHPIYAMKYLKDKSVSELTDDQYLKLSIAEKDKLINISLSDNIDGNTTNDYIDEVKQLYIRDEFSKNVQDWNNLRMGSVEIALTRMIIPDLKKELKANLIAESKEHVMRMCCKTMFNWIKTAPYSCDFLETEDEEWDTSEGIRVMAISYVPDYSQAAFACIVAPNGLCTGYLKLPHLLKRKNSFREDEKVLKEADLLAMRNFISTKKPHVVVIGGESREALMISSDIKECLMTLSGEEQFPMIQVEILDNNLAKICAKSNRGIAEFRDYPELLREAISLGRRLQDPLVEFSQLCTPDDEILCLKYHILQDQLPKEELLENLHLEFVNRVNEVGFDINNAIQHPYYENLVQFVCGLGLRKGHALLKMLKQTIRRLDNRTQLVTACHMGPKVFINCAGFIKIDTNSLGDSAEAVVDILDGSRVHPETYEWARKMAADALEEEDPAEAMEEILKMPERLKELDLDAFAEELERQGYGNKTMTLYDIRAELSGRYKDLRSPYSSPSPEELFDILTKETPETFYIGKLVLGTVIGMNYRKPDKDQLDQANPVRNDETGLWQCPFCLKNDFPEMSEVWNHFDVGTCPGKANGVRLRLENGMSGYIHIKNLSDNRVENPEERVTIGQVIHCRVTKIDIEKYSVECTSKTSDLTDVNNEWRPTKDSCYNTEAEEDDVKTEEDARKVKQRQTYVKRVIVHPSFHNINYAEAQKLMETMKQGDAIIRPSSKGTDRLTVTWKVSDNIYQHVDVREEMKNNVFSLGQRLWIGNEEFEDLDEIIARYINPMAGYVSELLEFRKYKSAINGVAEAEKLLKNLKNASPKEIPYFFSAVKEYPGKFMLSYLPRVICNHENVTVTCEGFRYRGQMFSRIDELIRWFKEHFRDPLPQQNTPISYGAMSSRILEHATPGSIPNMSSEAIARVAQNLPNHMIHSLSQAANQTPYTPGAASTTGYCGTLTHPNTPYTPSAQTPYMTPYQTPHYSQPTPRYGQQAPNHQFLHPATIMNQSIHQRPVSNQSAPMNNADDDSYDWGTGASSQPSDQSINQTSTPYSSRSAPINNATDDSFDWGAGATIQPTNQSMHQKSTSYSRRSNFTNNAEVGGRFNRQSGGGNKWPKRQNTRQRSTPYSRQQTSTNNTNDDIYDWGTGSSVKNENETNDAAAVDNDSVDWGTDTAAAPVRNNKFQKSTSYSRQPTSSNNGDDDMYDWGTVATGTNQTATSTNNAADDWGTDMAAAPVRNNKSQKSTSYSRQTTSTNNGDDDMYDWGTVATGTNQTDTSTNNAADDWGSDTQATPVRNNKFQKSTSYSRQKTSTNNGDDDMYDWGTVATGTNQSDTSINNVTDEPTFQADQPRKPNTNRKWAPYSRQQNRQNNGNDNGQTNSRSWHQNSQRRSGPSSYQQTANDNADNDVFDWGTVTQTQQSSQSETSTNDVNDDTFDSPTRPMAQPTRQNMQRRSMPSSYRPHSMKNDNQGGRFNRQRGGSYGRPMRQNMNRRSAPYSRQPTPTNNATEDSFDWGTCAATQAVRQNTYLDSMPPPRPSPPRPNTDDDMFDWGTVSQATSTSQNTLQKSMSPPRQSSPTNNGDDDTFDWGTGSTNKTEPSENNTTDDMCEWQTGAETSDSPKQTTKSSPCSVGNATPLYDEN